MMFKEKKEESIKQKHLIRGSKKWDEFIKICRDNEIVPVRVVDIEDADKTKVTGCEHCVENITFAKKNKCKTVLQRVDGWDIIGVSAPLKEAQ